MKLAKQKVGGMTKQAFKIISLLVLIILTLSVALPVLAQSPLVGEPSSYIDKPIIDVSKFAYVLIEPSGTNEYYGNVRVRYDFFLTPKAPRYYARYLYLHDGDKYSPSSWRNTPFHSHFVYFDADVSDAEVTAAGFYHLANFYEVWTQGWDSYKGGMRHGWDTATRIAPVKYLEPAICEAAELRATELKTLGVSEISTVQGSGETYPSTEIDIGLGAIDRGSNGPTAWTLVDFNNPANDTGTLDTFEIWSFIDLTDTKVGTFSGSGTDYDDRDYETIGSVTAGAKRTFSGLDCDVVTGDFPGTYYSNGNIESDQTGFSGYGVYFGDAFGGGSQTYNVTTYANDALSLYGTGATTGTDPPTNFVASDNLNDRVTCTWTKTVGATKYQLYRDAAPIGAELGDVATTDDFTAAAPTITPGNAVASDGTSTAYTALNIAGESANDGTTYSYTVRAWSAAGGWSVDSNADNGHRQPGALTYQWWRSTTDADSGYALLGGATTEAYNDTTAPAPTITAGNAVATDGTYTDKVALSLAGTSSNDGAGRWYYCVLNATGATQQTTGHNRGYRDGGALGYQWEVDRGAGWGDIVGATGATYDDTAAPAGTVTPGVASASDGTSEAHSVLSLTSEGINDGATNNYRCKLTAPDAANQTSGANTGFRRPIDLTYQWYRSTVDADSSWLSGGWDQRVKLTTDNTDIDGALSNFPILVYISASSGRNSADISFVFDELTLDANRKKIAITKADGITQLYVEIEKWDDANEKAWLWVKVPGIANDADTDLYLYYDKDHADNDTYVGDPNSTPAENVWDANFVMVQHMNDDPDNEHIKDSIGTWNGTKVEVGDPAEADAKIGKGQQFNPASSYINYDEDITTASTPVTIEGVIKPDIDAENNAYSQCILNTDFVRMHIRSANNSLSIRYDYTSAVIRSYALGAGFRDWAIFAGTFDGDKTLELFVDGVSKGTTVGASSPTANYPTYIGTYNTIICFGGLLDELRISDTIRSAAWIKATKESLWDDLLAFGSEEGNPWTLVVGGTTDPYNDTGFPANGDGRYVYCEVNATDAVAQDSTHDRGYRAVAPTVTTDACTGFGDSWAILNGTIDNAGNPDTVTFIDFNYGLTDAYGSSQQSDAVVLTTGDTFSLTITGLSAGSNYHYKAGAYNGAWGYGDDRVFSTKGSLSLYEHLNDASTGDSGDIYSNNWAAMQFTADTTSHTVNEIWLSLKRVGTPGTVTVSIKHADDAHKPTGLDLASATMDGDTLALAYNWWKFEIDEIGLEANEEYAIVVRALAGTDTNDVQWSSIVAGGLSNAVGWHSTDGSGTWISDTPKDYRFELWGNPSIDMLGANVFRGYLEDDDMLIAIYYENTYIPYYPDDIASKYFNLRLYDTNGTTLIASTVCQAWGNKPGAIYLSADNAAGLTEGSAYYIKLYGDFGDNPTAAYQLQAMDWRGDDLIFLDQWVITTAHTIATYYGIDLTTFLVGDSGTEVLNTEGGVIFSIGIPGLEQVRPNLYELTSGVEGYQPTDWTNAFVGETTWDAQVGTTVATTLTGVGTLFGIDGKAIGAFLLLAFYLGIAIAVVARGGDATIAVILAIPFVLLGTWLRLIDIAIIAVVASVAVLILVYRFWWAKT